MGADYSVAECRWIESYAKELAPAIDAAECGKELNGNYVIWLRLHPESRAIPVEITETDYEHGGPGSALLKMGDIIILSCLRTKQVGPSKIGPP